MKYPPKMMHSRPMRLGIASAAAVGLLLALPVSAQAASAPVPLGSAKSFSVLAGAGVTNTGATTLQGDLGTFPTTTVTGPGTLNVTGTDHHGDEITQGAKTDLVTAYDNAAAQGPKSPIPDDLTGKTLKPGVYSSASSIGLTGATTLDAAGDPDAVFVIQAGSTLTTGPGSRVNLVNGASPCNVFWQVGTSATLGTGSTFAGTVLAKTSVTATTGATVAGRLLASNGAVTLDTNNITSPKCAEPAAAAATPTPTPTSSQTSQTSQPSQTAEASQAAPQVAQVPKGSVSTGDGTTGEGTNALPGVLTGVLVLGGLSGTAAYAVRRRRLSS